MTLVPGHRKARRHAGENPRMVDGHNANACRIPPCVFAEIDIERLVVVWLPDPAQQFRNYEL